MIIEKRKGRGGGEREREREDIFYNYELSS